MKKMIYVRDGDKDLFEEAMQYGEDSLSQVIAEALRQYIAAKKAEREETLEVGTWRDRGANDVRKIAFKGRCLAQAIDLYGSTSSGDDRGTDWRLYQTEKGKFLVWWLDWSHHQDEVDVADYIILDNLPAPGTICCGTVYGDPSCAIPGELIEEAAAMLGQDIVEHLDV